MHRRDYMNQFRGPRIQMVQDEEDLESVGDYDPDLTVENCLDDGEIGSEEDRMSFV